MTDPRALTPDDGSERSDHDLTGQLSPGLPAGAVSHQPALLNGVSPRLERRSTTTPTDGHAGSPASRGGWRPATSRTNG
jgi:hypothetical protein